MVISKAEGLPFIFSNDINELQSPKHKASEGASSTSEARKTQKRKAQEQETPQKQSPKRQKQSPKKPKKQKNKEENHNPRKDAPCLPPTRGLSLQQLFI